MMLRIRLNSLFNVRSHEWARICVAWTMVFLTRVGFIVGWTILLASFLSQIGVDPLPLLFLGNALLVMLGTVLYRPLLHRLKRELLITYTVLGAATLLIASVFFSSSSSLLFFGLFLLAQGVFVTQISILISLFTEDLFSPLESQRVFPIIESAETLGGILGGLVLSSFAHTFPAYKFIILWVILLLFLLPIVLKFNPKTMEVPRLPVAQHRSSIKPLWESFQTLKKIPFLRLLMVGILLHWAIMNLVEFEYTRALQMSVVGQEGSTHAGEVYREDLMAKIGQLHLLFYSCALLFQLFFASRVLTALGVASSMLLHPLLTLFNVILFTLYPNLATASLMKGGFELSNIFFKNAYDSSFYAIPHALREDAKEFLQGMVKPLGAVLGTLGMLIFVYLIRIPHGLWLFNGFIAALCLCMIWTMSRLSQRYTEMCEQNLSRKMDLSTRLNAVEILGQKGHATLSSALQKIVKRPHEPLVLRESILKTLGLRENPELMEALLESLRDSNSRIRYAAIQSIQKFKDLREHLLSNSFTRHRVLAEFRAAIEKESEAHIREELLRAWYGLAPDALTDYLIEAIQVKSRYQAALIRILKLFPDPNLVYYLTPHLEKGSPEVKAACIVALWSFEPLRPTLEHHLLRLLESPSIATQREGILAAGDVGYTPALPILYRLKSHPNPALNTAALLALAQMEEVRVIPDLVASFLDPAHEWFDHTYELLNTLPDRFREKVRQALHASVLDELNSIFKQVDASRLEDLTKTCLNRLYHLYSKLSAHHEAQELRKFLDSQESASL